MESNEGFLNINLTDDELDRLLCFDDDNKIGISTTTKTNLTVNNTEMLDLMFPKSAPLKITKSSSQFDSGNASSDIFNIEFMEIDDPECINLCTKDLEKDLSQNIEKPENLPINLCDDEIKSQNNCSGNINLLYPSLNTNFQFSIPTLPESIEGKFLLTNITSNFENFCNNRLQFNQSSQNKSQLTLPFLTTDQKQLNSASDFVLKDFINIPQSILQLYQSVRSSYSDFAFVYAISAQLCQEFIPMDCYVTLKMTLLLSIASLTKNNKNDEPLPIITIGPDSNLMNRIMSHIGQNIPQRFLTQNDNLESIGGKMTHDTVIEAGPALLAKYGVFYLGDWSHIKSNHADKILKEIERGILSIDKSNLNYPLQCSFWSYWTGSFKNNTKDRRTLNSFMEIFGIPVVLSEKSAGEVLVDFIFEQGMRKSNINSVDELSISLNDMKEYLKVVSERKVDFSPEAFDITQKYFIASRTDRPGCLTQQSFTTLKKYSESFAKLSLRRNVIAADVVSSIYLAENSIQNIYGPGIYPSPEFITTNNYIGEVDVFMRKFENWLNDYIKRFN